MFDIEQGFKDRALHESTVREENDVHRRLLARMRAAEGVNPMHMVQVQWRKLFSRKIIIIITSPQQRRGWLLRRAPRPELHLRSP